jgi:hypothetical protein
MQRYTQNCPLLIHNLPPSLGQSKSNMRLSQQKHRYLGVFLKDYRGLIEQKPNK